MIAIGWGAAVVGGLTLVGLLVVARRRLKLRRDRAAVLAVVEASRAVSQSQGPVVDPLSGSRARKELLSSVETQPIPRVPAQREASR